MIHSFKNYLIEEDKVAYFTFGRFNPPTIGHEKLLDALAKQSGKNDYFVFASQSQDSKKNPLNYNAKVKHIRKMFPRHARRVMINKKVRTVFDAATFLYEKGYRSIVMTVGSDRVREFETLLERYNGQKGAHGFYNFQSISVASAGSRDPDADGVEGMSASKMRQFAGDNDFTSFAQGLGSKVSNKEAKKLFMDVRDGMGLKEETVFKRHVELEPISETREQFVQGKLFDLGDTVVVKESDEMGVITHLGTNYLVLQITEDKSVRKWLDDVVKVSVSEEKVPTKLQNALKARGKSKYK
jgi:phosphopantetheine adenylyltransferase